MNARTPCRVSTICFPSSAACCFRCRSERARNNYIFVRAVVDCDLAVSVVQAVTTSDPPRVSSKRRV